MGRSRFDRRMTIVPAVSTSNVITAAPKEGRREPRREPRRRRTREITIGASEDVVDNLYAAVQMNFDPGT